jgi:hypothetical protein
MCNDVVVELFSMMEANTLLLPMHVAVEGEVQRGV